MGGLCCHALNRGDGLAQGRWQGYLFRQMCDQLDRVNRDGRGALRGSQATCAGGLTDKVRKQAWALSPTAELDERLYYAMDASFNAVALVGELPFLERLTGLLGRDVILRRPGRKPKQKTK